VWADGDGWRVEPNLNVLTEADPIAQQAAQVAELSTKMDVVNRMLLGPLTLEISGATGPKSDSVNGVWRRTGIVSGGYAVYEKQADSTKEQKSPKSMSWREEATGKWWVGKTEQVGQGKGFATLLSDAVAPETRGKDGAQWRVRHGTGDWRDEPTVQVRCV
jgi:hypothetical protein